MRLALLALQVGLVIGAGASAQVLDDRMCTGRKSCTLIGSYPAGLDAYGIELTVVELGFSALDGPDDGGWGCRFDPDGYEGGREYWLVTDDHSQPERLATVCNDGYGAAMVGEDIISFADNVMVQERYGGSAWRWVDAVTMTLRPRQLLTRYLCSAYGPWTRNFEATDWTRSVSWYAWSPSSPEEETDWCPPIDPTLARPAVPKPYLLGLMIPAYDMTGLSGGGRELDGLGSCALGLAAADGPIAPVDQAEVSLRVVALLEPDMLTLRLVLDLDPELVTAAGGVRLDVARAEYEALDWLGGDRVDPSPVETFQFALPPIAGDQTSGDWTLRAGPPDTDGTVLFVDRAPAADMLELNLLGLSVSVTAGDDPDRPLVSTVDWRDGAPAHTPPMVWRAYGPEWPTCRLSDGGVLVLEGSATTNPLDYYVAGG